MENQSQCPICKTFLPATDDRRTTGDYEIIDCPRCGSYKVSRSLLITLPNLITNEEKAALLSYTIRKMQGGTEIPFLNTYSIETILKNKLPNLLEQATNLILWLGDTCPVGGAVTLPGGTVEAIMGARSFEGMRLVLQHVVSQGFIKMTIHVGPRIDLSLEFEGWNRYEEIKRGAIMSHKAFMAMEYGDKDLDQIFYYCFKPAVKATGFDLNRLDEHPRAGLIDDSLRVEIRTSRFLISDLTHENQGAYWEAGFAEGLGKPVIYTCEKSKFEYQKTHFDTNHHLTIMWEKNQLEDAAEKLKATIRATLPSESKLTDE